MRRQYLIIDGYNLLHAGGMAPPRAPGQLEQARGRLLRYLANRLSADERERATIVFDAADAPPGLPRELLLEGLAVRFAPPGVDADTAIEELIAAHSAPRQIRLVSSDHRLQRAARRRRGQFVDSDQFVDELDRRGVLRNRTDAPASEPAENASLGTLAEWLQVFGEVVGADELARETNNSTARVEEIDLRALEAEIDQEGADPDRTHGRRR